MAEPKKCENCEKLERRVKELEGVIKELTAAIGTGFWDYKQRLKVLEKAKKELKLE